MIKIIYLNCFIGMAIGLCFYLSNIKAYTRGLQHGKDLDKGNVPSINLNPVQAVREYKKEVKEEQQADIISKGIENLFNYTGDPQKEE